MDEWPAGQLGTHGVDRRHESWRVGPVVAAEDGEEQRGVHRPVAGGARVAPERARVTARFDELADSVALAPPAVGMRPREVACRGQRDGSVERDGAHHLRLREMRRLAPHLPDTGVGLTPERADEVGELSQTSCVLVLEAGPRPRRSRTAASITSP